MPSLFNVGKIAGDIIGSIGDVADDLFTSDEERKRWEHKKAKLQQEIQGRLLTIKEKLIEEQSSVLQAEIEGESWLQRSWRPITMLAMMAAVLGYWFGLTPDSLPQYAVEKMFTLVQIGVGGYIASRGAEKVTRSAGDSWRRGQEAKARSQ